MCFPSWIPTVLPGDIIELTPTGLILTDATSIQTPKTTARSMPSRKSSCTYTKTTDISAFWTYMLMPHAKASSSTVTQPTNCRNKSKLAFSPRSCQWTHKISNTKAVTSPKKTCMLKTEVITLVSKAQVGLPSLKPPKTPSAGLYNVTTTWTGQLTFYSHTKVLSNRKSP